MKRAAFVGAAAAVLLLAGGVAVAQPPRAGLCDGLSGDALTRCLYSDLDDRMRALEPTPTPTPSETATPTPEPTTESPTPTPTPTPAAADGRFGYMVFLNPSEEAKSRRDIDEVAAAGGTWVRMGIPEGQAGYISGTNWLPHTGNLDYFTRTVDYADAKGLKIVLVMADFFRSGTTVEDADSLPNDANDQKRAQLRQYLTEVDRRMGAKTDLYQVFNEHDVRDYRTYGATELTSAYLAAFRETLQVANDALSKPLTTTPFGYPVNQARYDRWVKLFDGVGSALDVVGVHAYPERGDTTISLVPTYMDRLGDRYNKPVALLEFGLPDVAGYGTSTDVGVAIVKQIQAADRSERLMVAALYQLRDRGQNNTARNVSGELVFGVLTNSYTQKAYYAPVRAAVVAANE